MNFSVVICQRAFLKNIGYDQLKNLIISATMGKLDCTMLKSLLNLV